MTFSSSINTGLQQVPDLTEIQTVGKLSFQFISIYNAINILSQAIDSYTGNAPATSTSDTQTAESTVLVGNTSNLWVKASVAISAGYLVNLTNTGGATTAQLASAVPPGGTSPNLIAHGLSMNTVAAGAQLQVLLLGLFNFGGSVTPGQLYYLSDTVLGALMTAPPTAGSGHLIQPVGFGLDTNSLWFNPSLYTPIA